MGYGIRDDGGRTEHQRVSAVAVTRLTPWCSAVFSLLNPTRIAGWASTVLSLFENRRPHWAAADSANRAARVSKRSFAFNGLPPASHESMRQTEIRMGHAASVRQFVNRQFARIVEPAKKFVADLSSDKDRVFVAAFSELVAFALFRSLGHKVRFVTQGFGEKRLTPDLIVSPLTGPEFEESPRG